MALGEIKIGLDLAWRDDIESWVRRLEASNAALRSTVERLLDALESQQVDEPEPARVPKDQPTACTDCGCCIFTQTELGNYECCDCRRLHSGWLDGDM